MQRSSQPSLKKIHGEIKRLTLKKLHTLLRINTAHQHRAHSASHHRPNIRSRAAHKSPQFAFVPKLPSRKSSSSRSSKKPSASPRSSLRKPSALQSGIVKAKANLKKATDTRRRPPCATGYIEYSDVDGKFCRILTPQERLQKNKPSSHIYDNVYDNVFARAKKNLRHIPNSYIKGGRRRRSVF